MKLLNIYKIQKLCLFNEKTSLHIAVEKGNSEIVKLLLACKGININAKYVLYN